MSNYFRYVIKNMEPLRIADDSTSQSGQTNTLRYIPGSSIRGLVINQLALQPDFERKKQILFSNQVRFLNAYPMIDQTELIPSPKGFYEDKTEAAGRKELENVVVNGNFKEGYKRASLGRYVSIEEDTMIYYNVETGSDLKIKQNYDASKGEKQNVFRSEYIAKGQTFVGYIVIDDPTVEKEIEQVFQNDIWIGNGKFSGIGKCRVMNCGNGSLVPYAAYCCNEDQKNSVYMMLLSNTVMRNQEGELCGLNLPELEKKMGVSNLTIQYCSTSVTEVGGYNRTWGNRTPSMKMYEQGSVFHFSFDGCLSLEKMNEIMNLGIGVRKNEGFGRVLFLKNYENIQYKISGASAGIKSESFLYDAEKHEEDAQVLTLIAKNYLIQRIRQAMEMYVVKNPLKKGNLKNSQLGSLEAFTTAFRYNPLHGKDSIIQYLKHANEKEDKQKTQKERASIKTLKGTVEDILNRDLLETLSIYSKDTVMGISRYDLLDEETELGMKLELITMIIRYDNKGV